MTRRSARELERLLDDLESAVDRGAADPDASVAFVDRTADGDRRYLVGGEYVDDPGERIVLGLTARVECQIDPESLEATYAHPIDPATGDVAERIVLEPDPPHAFVGIDGDADAVVRDRPALFSPTDDSSDQCQ